MRVIPIPPERSTGQPPVPLPLFEIDVATEDGTVVIRVKGELDLYERPRLERALKKAEASQARRVVLDLEELTFIDAAGIYALVAASRRSRGNGNRLRVTRGKGNVAGMFRLTALHMTLPFLSPTPPSGLAA